MELLLSANVVFTEIGLLLRWNRFSLIYNLLGSFHLLSNKLQVLSNFSFPKHIHAHNYCHGLIILVVTEPFCSFREKYHSPGMISDSSAMWQTSQRMNNCGLGRCWFWSVVCSWTLVTKEHTRCQCTEKINSWLLQAWLKAGLFSWVLNSNVKQVCCLNMRTLFCLAQLARLYNRSTSEQLPSKQLCCS